MARKNLKKFFIPSSRNYLTTGVPAAALCWGSTWVESTTCRPEGSPCRRRKPCVFTRSSTSGVAGIMVTSAGVPI